MCLLTFLPARVLPDPDALRNGTYDNDDGHGFAIATHDSLLIHRGMDAEAVIAEFLELRHRHPNGPALFHSRFATDGSLSIDNCHPFTLGNDTATVLAHNGVFPRAVRPARGDPRSDTRIVAEEFLPAFGSLSRRRTRQRFERWMRPSNLMVILTANRRFRERAYLFNESEGIWDRGIWYSNTGYRPLPPTHQRPHAGDFDAHDSLIRPHPVGQPRIRCRCCRMVLDPGDGACLYCGLCLDCDEFSDSCLCLRLGHEPALW